MSLVASPPSAPPLPLPGLLPPPAVLQFTARPLRWGESAPSQPSAAAPAGCCSSRWRWLRGRLSQRFPDACEEAAYASAPWRSGSLRGPLCISVVLLVALECALSFEYELSDWGAAPTLLVGLFLARVLPLAALALLLGCAGDARLACVWSPAAALAVTALSVSVSLHQLLCSLDGGAGGFSAQCALGPAEGGLLPWAPLVLLAAGPFIMTVGLACRWGDALLGGCVAAGAFVGLQLAVQRRDFIATPIVLLLASIAWAVGGAWAAERSARAAFRRELALRRKLSSVVAASVDAIVGCEVNARFSEVLRHVDAMVTEVAADGLTLWASPGSAKLLCAEPRDLLRTSTFLYVHAEDAIALRALLLQLAASGDAVAALAPPVHVGGVGARRPPPAPAGAANSARSNSGGAQQLLHLPEPPLEQLPPSALLHARLQFRRLRADGSGGVVWVDAHITPVIRRRTLLPGSAKPLPEGASTLLIVERDCRYERWRAAQAGCAVPHSAAEQLVGMLALAGGLSAPELPAAALAPLRPPPPVLPQVLQLALPPSAIPPAALVAIPAYDPYFERSAFAALIALEAALAAIRTLAEVASKVVASPTAALAAAAAAAAAALPEQQAFAPPGLHSPAQLQLQLLQRISRRIAEVASKATLVGMGDAVSIGRHRCPFLPVRPAARCDPIALVTATLEPVQHLIGVASALPGQQQLQSELPSSVTLTVDGRVPRAMQLDAEHITSILHVALQAGMSVPGCGSIKVSVELEPAPLHVIEEQEWGAGGAVTATSTRRPLGGDAIAESACKPQPGDERAGASAAAEVADGTRADAALERPPLQDGQPLPPLHVSLSFEASAIGGVDAITRALASDVLAPEAGYAPIPSGDKSSCSGRSPEFASEGAPARRPARVQPLPAFSSYTHLLPVLRLMVVCAGGTVRAEAVRSSTQLSDATSVGSGGGGEDHGGVAESARVALVLRLPQAVPPRGCVAGEAAVDAAVARLRIAAAPVDVLPSVIAAATVPLFVNALVLSPLQGATVTRGPPGAVTPAPLSALHLAPQPALHLAPFTAPAAPPPAETAGLHILFVDDELTNRRLGARMLQCLGCTCVLVEDGDLVPEALAAAAAPGVRAFDAMMLDIIMRRTDGAQSCAELRAAGVTLPIIAMTGNTGLRDVQRFLAAGFDLVLAKPFDVRALGTAICEGRARRAKVNRQAAERWAAAAAAGALQAPASSEPPGGGREGGSAPPTAQGPPPRPAVRADLLAEHSALAGNGAQAPKRPQERGREG